MLLALVLFSTALQAPDTSTYADEATARLIALARRRHAVQDTLVHDYQALVRTRVDAGFGRSRFARILPVVAIETAAQVTWARPNDLHVKILGARAASALRGVRAEGAFSNPWFFPRGLGDSIRVAASDIPETAALHPLAPGADASYRYAVFDSLIIELPERSVRAIGVRVEPKRTGPSLIAGNLWLDAATAEVVRLTFVFVGEYLWDKPDGAAAADSARARKRNARANRILRVEAELEYALHESRYWMPFRQLVTLRADIPWFISARVPVRFLTTFGAYRINTGVTPRFTAALADSGKASAPCRPRTADTLCAMRKRERDRRARDGYARAERWRNGRWQLEAPPRDSLEAYEWPDRLTLAPDPEAERLIRETAATLARVDRELPAEWVGRQTFGVAFDRFSDLARYNRVQGLSVGAGYRLSLGSGFGSVLGSARFGMSDRRLTGALAYRRDAPGGRLDIGLWRAVREAEPWTSGLGLGNSLNALFAAHDDADYHLAHGAGVTFAANTGALQDAELGLQVERLSSMAAAAHASVNDWLGGGGSFPPNAAIVPGDYVAGSVSRRSSAGPIAARYGVEGVAGVRGEARRLVAVRVWASARLGFALAGRSGALSGRSSGTAGDSLPHLMFRVGGPETTRGYGYGTRVGRAGWSVQLDFALGRSGVVSPVVFADAGNTFSGGGAPLIGAGGGLSFLGGLVRFNFARGLRPKTDLRFDLLFRTPR